MKQKLHYLLLGIIFSATSAYAIDQDTVLDFEDFGGEHIQASESNKPFSFTIQGDVIGKAKINKGFYKGDKIEFRTVEAELGAVIYYDEDHKEAINVAIDYAPTFLHWQDNPWFEQSHFNIGTFSIGGISERICRWTWRGQLGLNMDLDEIAAGFSYATYDILLWGRYQYCSNIGIHVGLILETGMRTDRVYPILGFDWKINKKWDLNMVFPLNVGIDYHLTDAWTLALQGRAFTFRDRVGRHEANARSVVRYDSTGGEFAIKYSYKEVSFNVHGGATLAGRLRIADQHNHHPRTYKLDSAGYAGGELTLRF